MSDDARALRILDRIRAIPPGFVRTYGDIDRRAPRLVGRVLATTAEDVPWHRVVRADGSVARGARQRALLRREGVPLRGDRVDLAQARLPDEVPLRFVRRAHGGSGQPPAPARTRQ